MGEGEAAADLLRLDQVTLPVHVNDRFARGGVRGEPVHSGPAGRDQRFPRGFAVQTRVAGKAVFQEYLVESGLGGGVARQSHRNSGRWWTAEV